MFSVLSLSYDPGLILTIIVIVVGIGIFYLSQIDNINERKKERKRKEMLEAEERQREYDKYQEDVRVAAFAEKYKTNPMTERLAMKAAEYFIGEIKGLRRDKRTTVVSYSSEGIGCEFGRENRTIAVLEPYSYGFYNRKCLLDFRGENLRQIENVEQLKGFINAIAYRAEQIFKSTYYRDESGTEYTLKLCTIDKGEKCYMIQFCYSARNGFYEAPKEW